MEFKGLKIVLLMFLKLQCVFSQDMHFSQFYASPLYLNPAFTGANACSRLSLTYRNQWPGIATTYKSYLGSFDHYVAQKNLGIGLQFANDESGSGALKTTMINPLLAYELTLSRNYSLRLGVQPGVTIKSINMNKLTFGDQLYRGGKVTTIEAPVLSRTFFDFGAGTLLYSSNSWLGISAYHINKPNESLFELNNSRLPIRYSLHGGYNYNLNRDEKPGDARQKITAAFNYRRQSEFDQLDIGFYYSRSILNFGLWYRGIPVFKSYKPGYKNNDALICIVGLEINKMNIGYSYDITISDLNNVSRGSHELTISYQLCTLKNKKKKHQLISCPKF